MSTVFIDKNSSTGIVSLSIEEQNNEALQSVSLRVSNTPQPTSYAALAESQELVATELAQYNSFEIDSNTLASAEMISLVGSAPVGSSPPRLLTEVVELPSSFVRAADMDKRTRMWFEQQKKWCSPIRRVKGSSKSDTSDGFPSGASDWPVTKQNMGSVLCAGNALVPSIKDPVDSFYLSRSSRLRGLLPSKIEKIGPIFNEDEPYTENTLGRYSYWIAPMYQGMMIPMEERLNPAYVGDGDYIFSIKAHIQTPGQPHCSKYRITVDPQSMGTANVTLLHTGTQQNTNGELRDYWKPYVVNNNLTGQNYISIRIEGEEIWLDTAAEVAPFTTPVLKKDEGLVDISYFSKENGGLVKRDQIRYKKYPWRYLKTPRTASTIGRREPTITGRLLGGKVIVTVRKDDLYLPEVGVSPWDTTTEEWRKAVKEKKKVQRMHVKLCNYTTGEKINLGHVILNGRSQAPGNGTGNEDIEITGLIEDNPSLSLRGNAQSDGDTAMTPNHYYLTFAALNLLPIQTVNSIGQNKADWYYEIRFSEWTLGIEHALRTNERFMYSDVVNGQSIFRNTWSSEHPSRVHKGILGQTLETETLESIVEESLSTYAYCERVISKEESENQIYSGYQSANYVSATKTETLEWAYPMTNTETNEKIETEDYGWKSVYGKVITDNNNETQDYYSVQPYYSFQLAVPPEKLGAYHKIATVKIEVKCRFTFGPETRARAFWPNEWNSSSTNPFVNHPLFVDSTGDALYHLVGYFHEIPDSGILEVRDFVGYSRAIDNLQKIYVEQYGDQFLPQMLDETGGLRTTKSPQESKLTAAGYRQHFRNVSELSLMLEHYLRERAYLTYRITWKSPYNSTNTNRRIMENVKFDTLEFPPQAPEDLSFFVGAATADNFNLGSWKPSTIPVSTDAPFGGGVTPSDKPIASVPTGYPFNRPQEWVEQIEAVQQYTPTMYSNYFIKF